jgi:hypothetical protein
MNEAIKLAIEKGGWKPHHLGRAMSLPFGNIILGENYITDPQFWVALGKALGWKVSMEHLNPTWLYYAQQYHKLVLTGGDIESFWHELLKGK